MKRKQITAGEFIHDLYERLVLEYCDSELAALACAVAATERGVVPPPKRSSIRLPRVRDDLCTRLVRGVEHKSYAASAEPSGAPTLSGFGVPSARMASPCDDGRVEVSP